MNKNKHGELVYYTFESFERTGLVRHGFSTRLGGVSGGVYASLNLGFARGDSVDNVRKNYGVLLDELGIDGGSLVFSAQTHTANVLRVGKEHRGNGFTRKNAFKDVDGLVTNERETALTTFCADCVPIFLLDPEKRAIGLSHAGWKGSLNRIAEETVRRMAKEFGSNPADILAGIGPSIGVCCFETNEPVWRLFAEGGFGKFISMAENGKGYINLWAVNREVLLSTGMRPENVETAGICTKCSSDVFFSHRSAGEKRGSMAAVMELI